MNRIALLGATGSIGTSCVQVVRAHQEELQISAISAHSNWQELARIAQEFRPAVAVISDIELESQVDRSQFPKETQLRFGPDAISEISSADDVDTVLAAIVGAAGLHGSWAAVTSGKRLAIANKETLVVAGPLIVEEARKNGSEMIPVDSEHSAIYQALKCGAEKEIERVILTASGGPFRELSIEEMNSVTPEMALKHPTWEMGPKITIDSATMMNKALEIIEARWLFDLKRPQIDVVIHPQSVIHSMVEFVDGSVMAQLSPPDMMLPIQFALTYPKRITGVSPRLNLTERLKLDLLPPNFEQFPALQLGFEVAEKGGTTGAVVNAANEVAVERFLKKEIRFVEISQLNRDILEAHRYEPQPTLEDVLARDQWAREESYRWNP